MKNLVLVLFTLILGQAVHAQESTCSNNVTFIKVCKTGKSICQSGCGDLPYGYYVSASIIDSNGNTKEIPVITGLASQEDANPYFEACSR